MIAAQLYQIIYLLLVTILTISLYNKYSVRRGQTQISSQNSFGLVLLVVFLIVFIGLRPVSGIYFVDMANYAQVYSVLLEGMPFSFDWNAENLLFDNYFAWVGSLRLGTDFFFTSIAAIYFGASYLGIRKLFPDDTLAAYLVFLGAFSTFSYATNGVKAGAAASLFILALAYRENLKVCIPLILVSWGFHHSMQLPVAAFVLTLFYKNPKWYLVFWILCLFMAMVHVTFFQNLFAGMSDESGSRYLTEDTDDWGGDSGFRLDFILYSAMPIWVGYWAMYKKKLKLSRMYSCLLNLYMLTNAIWMLCMYAQFTNRIAYLSWFLYPVVLIYPFLNEELGDNRYKIFSKVMLVHLLFTLFMVFIYY